MDGSFIGKNGIPGAWQTRLSEITTNVIGLFGGGLGIGISFNFTPNNTRIISSPADECKGITYPASAEDCTCYSNEQCATKGTSHHTSAYTLQEDYMGLPPTSSISYLLTTHNICLVDYPYHIEINGITFTDTNQIISKDYDNENDGLNDDIDYYYARATLVHEIGHLYGVEDHYGNGTTSGENDNCIWGDYRNNPSVVSKLSICTNCYNTIHSNRTKYQH